VGPSQWPVGVFSAKSSLWLKPLPTQLVCCLHKHLSQERFLFFLVLTLADW